MRGATKLGRGRVEFAGSRCNLALRCGSATMRRGKSSDLPGQVTSAVSDRNVKGRRPLEDLNTPVGKPKTCRASDGKAGEQQMAALQRSA